MRVEQECRENQRNPVMSSLTATEKTKVLQNLGMYYCSLNSISQDPWEKVKGDQSHPLFCGEGCKALVLQTTDCIALSIEVKWVKKNMSSSMSHSFCLKNMFWGIARLSFGVSRDSHLPTFHASGNLWMTVMDQKMCAPLREGTGCWSATEHGCVCDWATPSLLISGRVQENGQQCCMAGRNKLCCGHSCCLDYNCFFLPLSLLQGWCRLIFWVGSRSLDL